MKWTMKEPARGDMIRVESGSIYHFGIYVSDEEVIQFGLAPSRRVNIPDSEIEVLVSDIDSFLSGGFLEVAEFDRRERKKHRSPKEVVNYARSRLGTKGYNIIYNNCEHFANECISGEHISHQADDVREMFRNMPIVDVYIAELPERDIEGELSCRARWEEINGISNSRVKREKYYVWRLLEYGLQRSLGLKAEDINIRKEESGRYVADKIDFSLSHSNGALAVAVSRARVGVDIEPLDIPKREEIAERFMTPREYEVYRGLPEADRSECFIKVWTAKEALFKATHTGSFMPLSLETGEGSYRALEKNVGGKRYSLSVATATPERIRVFENIKL